MNAATRNVAAVKISDFAEPDLRLSAQISGERL
jgi:hypothetical protein